MTNVTYEELIEKVQQGQLTNGEQYRITDYVTTVNAYYNPYSLNYGDVTSVRSAGHAFDVVLTATSQNTLSRDATALLHSGDTYFSASNISGWRLKFITDTDPEFHDLCPWAEYYEDGGKGGIYYMQDNYGNEAGYDFKNIQFLRYLISGDPAKSDFAPMTDFMQKMKDIYSASSLGLDTLPLYIHPYAGYVGERELSANQDDTWQGLYTMSASGTRVFVVFYRQGDKSVMVAATNGTKWMYTYSSMQSATASEATDASETGNVTNCTIATQSNMFGEPELPYSVFVNTYPADIQILSNFKRNTCTSDDIYANADVTGCLLLTSGGLDLLGSLVCVVVLDKDIRMTLYANSYAVLNYNHNYWSIPFVSLSGLAYEIRIHGCPGSVPVELTGAETPIKTEEDKSDDMFLPIRTQSGYVNVVVDSSFDYTVLLASDNFNRHVELIRKPNNSVAWDGYIKAQNFDIRFFDYNITISMPVIDGLTNMDNVPFAPNIEDASINLAAILHIILSSLETFGGTQYTAIITNWSLVLDDDAILLNGRVNTSMFYTYDDNAAISYKYSCGEVLRNLMTYLGCTLRIDNHIVYIISPDTDDYVLTRIEMDQLRELAEGTAQSGLGIRETPINLFNRQVFANTSNKLRMLQGAKTATVECDQQLMSMNFSMPNDELADKYYKDHNPEVKVVHDNKQLYTLFYSHPEAYRSKDWLFVPYEPCKLRIWELRDSTAGPYFRWSVGVEMRPPIEFEETAFIIKSTHPVFLKNCIVAINANGGIYNDQAGAEKEGEIEPYNYYITMAIHVGDYSYDGVRWLYKQPNASFLADMEDGRIDDSREVTSKDAEYEGYGAIVKADTIEGDADSIYGYMTVMFKCVPAVTLTFTDISVEILPNVKSGENYNGKKDYKVTRDVKFKKDIKKSTFFITDPSGQSTSPLNNMVTGLDVDPPAVLARRMADYNSVLRRVYNVIVRSDLVELTPMSHVKKTTQYYHPISISNDWRNDEMDVHLIEEDR